MTANSFAPRVAWLTATFLVAAVALLVGAKPSAGATLPEGVVEFDAGTVSGRVGAVRDVPMRITLRAGPSGAHGYLHLAASTNRFPGSVLAPQLAAVAGESPVAASGSVVLGATAARSATTTGCSGFGLVPEKQLSHDTELNIEVSLPPNGAGVVSTLVSIASWYQRKPGERIVPIAEISESVIWRGRESAAVRKPLSVSEVNFANPGPRFNVFLGLQSGSKTRILRRGRANTVGGYLLPRTGRRVRLSLFAGGRQGGRVRTRLVSRTRSDAKGRFRFRIPAGSLPQYTAEIFARAYGPGPHGRSTSCAAVVSTKR